MKIVVTGYAGFIGSNLTRMLLEDERNEILGIDCFTYAARADHVYEKIHMRSNFKEAFIDIRDTVQLEKAIKDFNPDQVYHLAAESHVCKSIEGPRDFATTNFMGTFNILEALQKISFKGRMVHVSTDETFGELGLRDEPFTEETMLQPRSPYAASKAASDLMVQAYYHTYGLNCMITRCSNNYGPNQHTEKLIPKTIMSFLNKEEMTIYGNGENIRDWIYVDHHCKGLMLTMKEGRPGEVYCIGSGLELTNKEVIHFILEVMCDMGLEPELKFRHTNDRPTDDRRYAIDSSKIRELGFWTGNDTTFFKHYLKETIKWYMEHRK